MVKTQAVELDNLFGGLPIQHREVQGFESVGFSLCETTEPSLYLQKRFKDQFPDGIMIKKGGMESGLQKAETNAHEAKLFKVAGGMRPVMTEVTIATLFRMNNQLFSLIRSQWPGLP